MSGFIKLHRKVKDNPLFRKNPRARILFEDILLDAAWKTTVQDWQGQPIKIGRGQLMMSQREMAAEYGLTRQQLRTLLKSLESHNMLKINPLPNQGPMVITVCKYSEFQGDQPTSNPQPNQPPTHLQPTKEEREEKEEQKEQAASSVPCGESESGGQQADEFEQWVDRELIEWVAAGLNPFAPEATGNAEAILRAHCKHYPPSQVHRGLTQLRANMAGGGFKPRDFSKAMNGYIAKATAAPEQTKGPGLYLDPYDKLVPTNVKPADDPWFAEMREDPANAH